MSDARVTGLDGLLVKLDAALAAAAPNEVAALSREKRQIMAELASLAGTRKGSAIDELAKQRASRRTTAAVPARAGRGGQQRRKRSG